MIDRVDKFQYLGCILTDHSRVEVDIMTRIAACSRCLAGLYRVTKARSISRAVEVRIYNTLVRPVELCVSECWTISEYWKDQLGVWERKGRLEKDLWHCKRSWKNAELERCYKTTGIVISIRTNNTLGWAGHVQ
jgi:hypothetical protein